MAVTQTQRDELAAAIAAGVNAYTAADGRQVRYGTIDEMMRALAWIDSELASANASSSGLRTTYASVSRD